MIKLPEIDFNDLDIRSIGTWPFILRMVVIGAACVIALTLGYYVIIRGNIEQLEKQYASNSAKRKEFKEKFNMSSNLPAYEKQMVEIKETYKRMLKQLPMSDQLPELIENISRLAENDRLKYQSIKPGEAKSVLGFYKELPLDLNVSGTYNGFGSFVSDIAKIPRIVTLHDFTIKRGAGKEPTKNAVADTSGVLTMSIQLKTYWLSSDPDADAKNKRKIAADKSKGVTSNPPAGKPGGLKAAGTPGPPASRAPAQGENTAPGMPNTPDEDARAAK